MTERFGGMTGPAEDPDALAIFAESGIQVLPAHVMPFVGQTSAIATLDRTRSPMGDHFPTSAREPQLERCIGVAGFLRRPKGRCAA